MIAKTDRAGKILDYYIKLEEVNHELLIEEHKEQQLQLQLKDTQLQVQQDQYDDSIINNFKKTGVVYMGLAEDNVIKIGISKDIERRLGEHRREIRKDFKILYIFKTIYYINLERAVLEDEFLNNYRTKKVYLDGELKTELFNLDKNFTHKVFYEYIIKLKAVLEKEDLLTKEISELKEDNNSLKSKIIQLESKITQLEFNSSELKSKNDIIKTNQEIKQKQQELDSYTLLKIPTKDERRYQIYNGKTLNLIQTFECMDHLMNHLIIKHPHVSPSAIRRNMNENKLYYGYRFFPLERNEEITEYELEPTVVVDRTPNNQQLVKFHKDDNKKILGIYSCSEEAAKSMQDVFADKTLKRIKKTISNNTSSGILVYGTFRVLKIDKVDEELIEEYLSNNSITEIPEIKYHKNNREVYKYDKNWKLLEKYRSISECLRQVKTTDSTLKKSIKNKTILYGFYFSFSQ